MHTVYKLRISYPLQVRSPVHGVSEIFAPRARSYPHRAPMRTLEATLPMSTHAVLVTWKLDSLFEVFSSSPLEGVEMGPLWIGCVRKFNFPENLTLLSLLKQGSSGAGLWGIPVVLTPWFCYETHFSWKTTCIWIYYSTHSLWNMSSL